MTRLSAPLYRLKRRAKLIARDEKIPLHAALDRVAVGEGFAAWSHLSAWSAAQPPIALLPELVEGDTLLLGAKPGHGKTRLGLRLLVDAARAGRRAVLFTLEYSERDAEDRIRALGGQAGTGGVEVVASDGISAETVAAHLAFAPRGTVAVIDYLQILDQQRSKPPLSEQVGALRRLALSNGFVLAFISQIDRRFDDAGEAPPSVDDLRLPNPVDLAAFSKACFIHGGVARLQRVA